MSEFIIKPQDIIRLQQSFQQSERSLKRIAEQTYRISNSLSVDSASANAIRQALRNASGNIDNVNVRLNQCAGALMEITALYEEHERRVGNSTTNSSKQKSGDGTGSKTDVSEIDQEVIDKIVKILKDYNIWERLYLISVLGPLLPVGIEVIRYFVELIRESIERATKNASFYESIKDEKSRNYLRDYPEYTEIIREKYEKASGKSKEVFDKYKDNMKISTMNHSGVTSYSPGKDAFNLKHSETSDPRGANKIFYHEYGHYIVDQNKWVYMDKNGNPQESKSFRKFHEALDREAKAYIKSVEDAVREEYTSKYGKYLTPDQLESRIHDETVRRMSDEIGHPDSSVNAVQDIISAASGDEYRIAYGHSSSYWSSDYTNQGNEGFAQFYTIDFNNSEMELDFIKKHFPDAYKEYQHLLDEALS